MERVASQCQRTPLSSAWAAHESWTTRRTNEFRVVEPILGAVREAGLGGAEAAVHYRMIGDTRLAYVGQQAAFLMFDADARAADDSAWNREYRLVDPQHFPNVTRLSGELAEVTDAQIFDATVVALISAGEGGKPTAAIEGTAVSHGLTCHLRNTPAPRPRSGSAQPTTWHNSDQTSPGCGSGCRVGVVLGFHSASVLT